MRALLCVPAYTPANDYGGPVTKLRLLARALAELGVDTEILTADFGFGRSRVPTGRRLVETTPVTYVRRVVSRGHLSVCVGAGSFMKANSFDVVHCFGLRDGLVTRVAQRAIAMKTPLVVEPMGMTPARVRSLRMKGLFDRAVGNRITGRAALTIATSEREEQQLRSDGFPHVALRYNPVDVPAPGPERANEPAARYDICYVGRLHRVKRLNDILRVVADAPGLTAVIAGPDEDGTGAELHAEAVRLGVEARVAFPGWVDGEQRLALLRSSRCFVLPSTTENFGNAAAEAMAAGRPVVVTRECGIAALVARTGAGAVTEVGAVGLAAGVTDVLRRDHHAASEAARTAVHALNPATIAAAQRDLYHDVLEGRRP